MTDQAQHSANNPAGASERKRLITLVLCVFLGPLGIHRFYAGKVITGIIWLVTGGVAGFGWIIDIIMILLGVFKDKQGHSIKDWM